MASGAVRRPGLHPGRPAAIQVPRTAPGPSGRRCWTTAAPAPAERGQRRLRVLARRWRSRRDVPAADAVPRRRHHGHQRHRPTASRRNEQVALMSAQGELPRLPALGQPFAMVELRSARRRRCSASTTADARRAAGAVAGPRRCTLDDLQLTGLRTSRPRTRKAGSSPARTAARRSRWRWRSSKSITCRSCNSLIDLSAGHRRRTAPRRAGRAGAPADPAGHAWASCRAWHWQVVGFQHRMGQEPGDDEQFGWDEYLLYNAKRGFSFLVDADDGWSLVKPITGAPVLASSGAERQLPGHHLQAEVQLQRRDHLRGRRVLLAGASAARRPSTAISPTASSCCRWSSRATRSPGPPAARSTATRWPRPSSSKTRRTCSSAATPRPSAAARSIGIVTIIVILIVILIVLSLLSRCSRCDPRVENCSSTTARSSGGSCGGYLQRRGTQMKRHHFFWRSSWELNG